jgi:tRNA1Val (adenine37-N6)-methyltransferase
VGIFKFKHFQLHQNNNVFPVGTDAMILGAYAANSKGKEPSKMLDIGCGSGVLSLILISTYKNAHITSIDLNPLAVQLTEFNLKLNNIGGDQFTTHVSSFLTCNVAQTFDRIICNPPYFTNDLKSQSDATALAKHDDYLPLDKLFVKVSGLMHSESSFWLIYPFDARKDVIGLAWEAGLHLKKVIHVFGKPENKSRMIYAFSQTQSKTVEEEYLTIRAIDGKYTDQYITLTKNLHGVKLV